jgi:TatD DNase family protein
MDLVDTHCHIQSIGEVVGERTTQEMWAKAKDLTPDSVLINAKEHGVTRLICVGCDLEDSRLAINYVKKNRDNCWASVGIHPHEAKEFAGQTKLLEEFKSLLYEPKVVAVGECGLDYYYNHSPKEAQVELLKFQIQAALGHDLPLIFHVREAFDDFWPIFNSFTGIKGVLHSFTDNQANLDKALERNLLIGVNGIATFTKDEAQRAVYKSIPLDSLLLETDAPFLTPSPYRGSINEPKRLGAVADYLATLRGESRENLAKTTTQNAIKLFGLG